MWKRRVTDGQALELVATFMRVMTVSLTFAFVMKIALGYCKPKI
jgi:hypothetical protein